ncbi:hypothetical protein MUN82_20090 [Hymenobacter aerilatus]|uniref:Uncharacterized protein n=1 Tax=Hymenobacter aerilatus TaxID=2932251 RepID=A0A8T9SV12_9BACT|nr:hypothetical protein [Hymenobacter aerilatus]UOR05221.1 hypothetical protein MUN82_20090 [Hymenobacter aerilatus]
MVKIDKPLSVSGVKHFVVCLLLLCLSSCGQTATDPQADVRAILGAVAANPQLWAFARPHAEQQGVVSIRFLNPVVYNRRFIAIDNFELPGRYPVRWVKVQPTEALLTVEAFSIDDNQAAIFLRMPVQGVVATFYLTKQASWTIWYAEVVET